MSATLVFQSALTFAKLSSFRVSQENAYAVDLADQLFGDVKNVREFIKRQYPPLNSRDKKFLLRIFNGKKWPKIQKGDGVLLVGDTYRVRFTGLYSKKIEINGVPFKLDFNAPLEIQAEVIARKLSQNKRNAFYDLLVPPAEAAIPAILLAIGGVIVRVVVSTSGTAARTAAPAVLSGTAGSLVTATLVFEKDPYGLIVCRIMGASQTCEAEDGTEVPSDIIDAPGTDYNVQLEIDKCPDTADGTFRMKMRVPDQRMTTYYTVATEQVDGTPRIRTISEVHDPDGEEASPPVEYSFDAEGLRGVRWIGSVVTADGSTHEVHRALDRAFSREGSADNTAENRERWESFRQKASLVRQTLALYCQVENKRAVSEPSQTQPTTEVVVPEGSSEVTD